MGHARSCIAHGARMWRLLRAVVQRDGVEDHLLGVLIATDMGNLGPFAGLEILVVGEEVLDALDLDFLHIADILDAVKHFFTHYKDLEPGKWAKISHVGGYEDAKKVILDSIALHNSAK